jgi:hypothetical protein
LASATLAATSFADGPAESRPDAQSRYAVFLRFILSQPTAFQEERRFSSPYDTPAPLDERGRFQAQYDYGIALGADVGLRVQLYRRIAIWLDYATMRRAGSTEVDLHLPHPFFPGRIRQARGSSQSVVFSESAIHADIALLFDIGRMKGTVIAGASYFRVNAELLDDITYHYVYPYENLDLTVVSLRHASISDTPLGFNCGLSVDYPVNRFLGAGLLLRYARARALFVPEPGIEIVDDVGGPQASVGVSFYF